MDAEEFLARIGGRLRGLDPPPLPQDLPPTALSGGDASYPRFEAQLASAGGVAKLVGRENLADTVAGLVAAKRSAVCNGDIGEFGSAVSEGLARAGCVEVDPASGTIADVEVGVTGALCGVCASGSVLLVSSRDSARSASLLPPMHIAVLAESALVGGLDDALRLLSPAAKSASGVVLVTGPSRTSDIELNLVRGVHGPQEAVVLVVEDA